MWLGFLVAVAVAHHSCNSDSTPSLGTSICCMCGPKKQTNKTKMEKGIQIASQCIKNIKPGVPWWLSRLRIQCCCSCGVGSIPDLEISAYWL